MEIRIMCFLMIILSFLAMSGDVRGMELSKLIGPLLVNVPGSEEYLSDLRDIEKRILPSEKKLRSKPFARLDYTERLLLSGVAQWLDFNACPPPLPFNGLKDRINDVIPNKQDEYVKFRYFFNSRSNGNNAREQLKSYVRTLSDDYIDRANEVLSRWHQNRGLIQQYTVEIMRERDKLLLPQVVQEVATYREVHIYDNKYVEPYNLANERLNNFYVLEKVFVGEMNTAYTIKNLSKDLKPADTWFASVVVPAILQHYMNDDKECSEYAAALVFVLKNSTMWQEKNRGQRMAALTSFCQKNPDNYRNTLSLVGKEKRNQVEDLSIGGQVLLLHLFLFAAIDNLSLAPKDGALVFDSAHETISGSEETFILSGDNAQANTKVNDLQETGKDDDESHRFADKPGNVVSPGRLGNHPTTKRLFLAQYLMQLGGAFVGSFVLTYCLGFLYLYWLKDFFGSLDYKGASIVSRWTIDSELLNPK
jgi:hypothetical protein